MKNISLYIKNYKCFGETPQGFDRVLPINVIIGRNNSGKSSLLDLLEYAASPHDLSTLAHKHQKPKVLLKILLSDAELRKVFQKTTSGGGIPANNHWEYARNWVGKSITVELRVQGEKTFLEIEKPMVDEARKYLDDLARVITNPFKGKKVKRLKAERDIIPEVDQSINVSGTGEGATNIIQQFINKASLPSDLVEKKLLQELNKIMQPDSIFTDIVVQQRDDNKWEIFLEESTKGRIAISQSGSGLKTILLVLTFIYLLPALKNDQLSNYIFAFEEIENNLHPSLQRRLFLYLREIALQHNTIFFLTTHSSVVIDLFSSDRDAQLIHVLHDGNEARVNLVQAYIQKRGVLDDLDIRASDLLQSNGVVWVEGPSDRLYFNRWVELWSDGQLREGAHYQCVFYGGRLLAHLTANPSEEEESELMNVLQVNRNSIILIDSDRENDSQGLNSTKQRIQKEMSNINALCWVTNGREIENYTPTDAISMHYEKNPCSPIGQYQAFDEYLDSIKSGEGKKFLANKVVFAEKMCPFFTKDMLSETFDMKDRLDEVCDSIKKWNGIS